MGNWQSQSKNVHPNAYVNPTANYHTYRLIDLIRYFEENPDPIAMRIIPLYSNYEIENNECSNGELRGTIFNVRESFHRSITHLGRHLKLYNISTGCFLGFSDEQNDILFPNKINKKVESNTLESKEKIESNTLESKENKETNLVN